MPLFNFSQSHRIVNALATNLTSHCSFVLRIYYNDSICIFLRTILILQRTLRHRVFESGFLGLICATDEGIILRIALLQRFFLSAWKCIPLEFYLGLSGKRRE